MSDRHRQYIKVPYAPKIQGESTKFATVEQVQAALPAGINGLEVDESLRYPSVTFPPGTPYATMKHVVEHLKSQGFEVDL